jgi:hypothetical protein
MEKKANSVVVDSVPPPKRASKNNKWDDYALVARLVKKPVLAGKRIRNSTVKSLRQYSRPPFVTPEGRTMINLRNSAIEADGERYGDVYMTWVLTDKQD